MEKSKFKELSAANLIVKPEIARVHAFFHLYSIIGFRSRGTVGWEKARVSTRPINIYDLSGLPLFYDFRVQRGRNQAGFIRIAANKTLGDSVISTQVSPLGWDIRQAKIAFKKLLGKKYARFSSRGSKLVCYSYPKLALSTELFSKGRKAKTVLMDVADFSEIRFEDVKDLNESGQNAVSLLDKLPREKLKKGPKNWEKINQGVDEFIKKEKKLVPAKFYELGTVERLKVIDRALINPELIKKYIERILDFCCHAGGCRDHECFCLHPQENNVHCTRASSQMVLCFWRYCVSQHDVAQAFGVADTALTPWASVAGGLNSLTNDCFTASLDYSVAWSDCESEIQNRRPFLSDTGGHTRACAGTQKWWIWILGQPQPRYLYIFDPWPANTGAIYWENFNTGTYAWNGTLIRKTTNHI